MDATAEESQFDPIEAVLADVRAGKPVIVTDDAGRENEGDLILAAEKASAESVAFMVKHTSGVICVPMEGAELDRLELPLMTPLSANTERMRTAYTISVDAAEGVTTGISPPTAPARSGSWPNPAPHRATSRGLGTFFHCATAKGGVLRRAGHTEASVDLARLAGLRPAGVLAEIVNDDGTMARVPELIRFKAQHGLKLCTIDALIAYRRQREKLVERVEVIQLPTDYGDFQLYLYRNKLDDKHHLALVKGRIDPAVAVPVRVHSECLTGDVFGSCKCDCGGQLHAALSHIEDEGAGVLVYLRQEGRGIGLAAKIHAYKLQEEGLDTVQANEKLGFAPDLRDYGLGAQILLDVGVRKFRFLTNNPRKVVGLEGYGLEMVEQIPIRTEANPHNEKYLRTKKLKLGHLL